MDGQNEQWNVNMLSEEDQEAFFQKAVVEFPDSLITAHMENGRICTLSVGAGVAALLGYDAEELADDPGLLFDIVHPADEERVRSAFARLAIGELLVEVYRIFRKNGQLGWIRISAVASKDSLSGVYHVMGIVSDAEAEKPTSDQLVQYKQLLDQTPAAVCLHATSGRIIYCNEAYATLIGRGSVQEAMLTTFDDVIPPQDIDWFKRDVLPEVMTVPWQGELRIIRGDGQIRDVHISTNALRGPNGEPIGVYATLTDITERKYTEAALRESEEKYRNLVERSNDGIVVIQDSVFKLVNQRFMEMSGYSAEQLLGARFTDFLTSEEAAILQKYYMSRMTGEVFSQIYDMVMTRADGNKIDVELNAGVITYEGRPADLVLFRDRREKKRAEEALRESEEKLRTLVDNVDAIIFRISSDLHPVTLGGQLEKWTGYTAEELTHETDVWPKLLSPEDMDRFRVAISRAIMERAPASIEVRVKHKSGSERWLRGQLTPRFDEEGNLLHFDGVGLDITERVEALERETHHSHLIAILVEMSQIFVSTRNADKIISTAIRSTAHLLDCICSVFRIDPATDLIRHVSVYYDDDRISNKVDAALEEVGLTGEDVFGSEGVHVGMNVDLMHASPRAAQFAQKTGTRFVITIPMYVEGEVFGVLAGGRIEGAKPFDDEDLWFFSEVASHASAALTNASLYRRQARIAETLQRSLIPIGPTVPGIETATSYFPALGEAAVGGDFFDIIDFEDGTVGLVVGDVSGKGLEAAIHTAEAKYMLRGFAHQNCDPGYVMTNLNRALWAFTDEFTFVTMFYALIDPANRTIAYVNAGHECSLILRRHKGLVHELSPNGLLLGVLYDQNYDSQWMELTRDDLLFCYTDGVIDVSCDGGRFGYERLVEVIKQAPGTTSQELLDHVNSEVTKCSKGNQPDDQVIVVIRLLT